MIIENKKIAIFSSADPKIAKEYRDLAKVIAHYFINKDVILVTGGSLGLPGFIIEEFSNLGGETIMFSPDPDPHKHKLRFDNHDLDYYNHVVFGNGFTSRSLEMIKYVDGAVVLNGRTGTLCEFTIAVEEGLPVAVITNTGGISDHLSEIIKIVDKEFPASVFFGDSVEEQLNKLLNDIV